MAPYPHGGGMAQHQSKQRASYGAWPSPISARTVSAAGAGIMAPTFDGDALYWLESRPKEGGRLIVMRLGDDDAAEEITPAGYNVRTRVHEYGGGAYHVANGVIYFANFSDQTLYMQLPGGAPKPLTVDEQVRFADFVHDPSHARLISVREDHRSDGEAINAIVAIDLNGNQSGKILITGADFYAYPRPNAPANKLAWIAWDHPNMPWDNVGLFIADVDAQGEVINAKRVNEGFDESVLDLKWSAKGDLHFIADRSGWWNLYRFDGCETRAVTALEAELAGPLWGLGQSNYALLDDNTAIISYSGAEGGALARADLSNGSLVPINTDFSSRTNIVGNGSAYAFIAGSTTDTQRLVRSNTANDQLKPVRQPSSIDFDPKIISVCEPIEFPTQNRDTAHAHFYPPHSPTHEAADDAPPLIVKIHGGPTAQSSSDLQLAIQYWTSRGFAVVDVNYSGSSGYGRAYRKRLNGAWGVRDLTDTIDAVKHLINTGKADANKVAIRGGSAGGYTTLSALAFSDIFKAGANYYGVSDLEALAKDTHKFESRYLDTLVAPYPSGKKIYEARSPIHHLAGFSEPLIVFQGLEDEIVPPNQSELIVAALTKKGVPVAYLPFEGEQHGFRRAENIVRSLEAELYFYGKIFGFEPADKIEPVQILNLDDV
jgi:dipeptidyl aminopeptidase/acylaminoacyl peptidase